MFTSVFCQKVSVGCFALLGPDMVLGTLCASVATLPFILSQMCKIFSSCLAEIQDKAHVQTHRFTVFVAVESHKKNHCHMLLISSSSFPEAIECGQAEPFTGGISLEHYMKIYST